MVSQDPVTDSVWYFCINTSQVDLYSGSRPAHSIFIIVHKRELIDQNAQFSIQVYILV